MRVQNIFFYLSVLLCCVFTLNSCSEDLTETNKGYDVLTLTADKEVINLNENDAALTALTLKWTSGTNYGTGARLNYKLELREKGSTEPTEPLLNKRFNDQELSYAFTVRELNDYLHAAGISLTYGETVEVEATVIAEVVGYEDYEQNSSVSFKVTTYEPVSETLYICGDATEGGWYEEQMGVCSLVDNQQPGIFNITATLTEGKEFKFFTQMDFFSIAYVCAPDGEQILSDGMTTNIIQKVDDTVDDLKFQVTETGTYKLTIDLLNNTLNIVKSTPAAPAFNTLYFVGSFTNWTFKPMKQDPVNPFVFLYGDVFTWTPGGEFKFGTMDGSWDNMYMATQDKAPYTDTNVKLGGTTDQKWVLKEEECGKAYKIRLDITTGQEKMVMAPFEPYTEISLIGNATPAGWTLPSSAPMTKINEYTYQWTGNLTAGEIKFTCDNQSDWMGAWFMAVENGLTFEAGEYDMYWIDKTNPDYGYGSLDNKWVVTDPGNYTITLNQATEKLVVKKID